MNPKRILCPIDFSDYSQKALRNACEQAQRYGAKLFIVHVDRSHSSHPPGCAGYVAELDEHKRLLDEAKPCIDSIDFEHHYLRGHVTDEILRFARLRNIDLIVMGSHGRTGLARALMGNVAASISENAPCEVVTISMTDKAKTSA